MRAVAVACVLLVGAAPAWAEQWTAPGGGFTVEFPDGDGWNAVDVPANAVASLPPGAAIVARRTADGSRAAIVTTFGGAPEQDLTDEIVQGFEAGLFRDKPAKKLGSSRVMYQGKPAYHYLAEMPGGARMAGVLTMRNRVTYHLQAVRADGDPTEDKELVRFLDSYRLP